MARVNKRCDVNDVVGIVELGDMYFFGYCQLNIDAQEANRLYLRAGELGSAEGYFYLGNSYESGHGVEADEERAVYYWERAAIRGNVGARYNLGVVEEEAGNYRLAIRHWMISAGAGCDDSLESIRESYTREEATKEEYEQALRTHYEAKLEITSVARDSAADCD